MLRNRARRAAILWPKLRGPKQRWRMRKPTGRRRNRCWRRTSVHAPSAGTVYSLNVNATEFAEQGKLLLQMADLHQERVRAYFDEPEIGKLAVGQPILIKWDAKPGMVWHGHIERIPITVITYGTRNVGEGPDSYRRCGRPAIARHPRHGHGDHIEPSKRAEHSHAKRCDPRTARRMSSRSMATS